MTHIIAAPLNEQTQDIADMLASLAIIANDRVTIGRFPQLRLIAFAFDTRDIGARVEHELTRHEITFGYWTVNTKEHDATNY